MKRIVYGTGRYGKILNIYLKKIGVAIDYFAKTKINKDDEMIDKLISFDEILNIDEDIEIYFTLRKTNDYLHLSNVLKEKKNNASIFNMVHFIEDNCTELLRDISSEGSRYCNLCNNRIQHFNPGGINEELFQNYRIIGGGYRENCKCPICGGVDRERLIMYTLNHIDIEGKILHFAPELYVSSYLRSLENIDYYSCDIVPGRAMYTMDITDIKFKDKYFDYIISNHVLEHIKNEKMAIEEIKRVLKNDGKWMLSFPVCKDIKTIEDDTITDPVERRKIYGQEDHVRLYGNDYIHNLEKYGFSIKEISVNDIDPKIVTELGLAKDDFVLVAEKR